MTPFLKTKARAARRPRRDWPQRHYRFPDVQRGTTTQEYIRLYELINSTTTLFHNV